MTSSILEAMIVASLSGGNILRKYFERENFSVIQKSVSYDLVTNIDKESQEGINSILTNHFPDIPVVGEEGSIKAGKQSRVFYVDPLDGTFNFANPPKGTTSKPLM